MYLPLPRLRAWGPQRPGQGSQRHAAWGAEGTRWGGLRRCRVPYSRDVPLHFRVLASNLKEKRTTLWSRHVFGGIWLRSLPCAVHSPRAPVCLLKFLMATCVPRSGLGRLLRVRSQAASCACPAPSILPASSFFLLVLLFFLSAPLSLHHVGCGSSTLRSAAGFYVSRKLDPGA